MLQDPFVLALPHTMDTPPEAYLSGQAPLPFLRYSQTQIIGRLIEAQLRRLRITLPNRFELDSNQSLMGMGAEGHGWAITTPSSFARARRFRDRIALYPFPDRGFGRTLSLFATEVHVEPMAQLVSTQLRQLIRTRLVAPVLADHPWLGDSFHLMADPWGPV